MVDYTIITQGDLGESLEVKSVNGAPKVDLKISNESNNALSLDQNGLFINQNTVKGSWTPVIIPSSAQFNSVFDLDVDQEVQEDLHDIVQIDGGKIQISSNLQNIALVQPFSDEKSTGGQFDFNEPVIQAYFTFEQSELDQNGEFKTSVGYGSQFESNGELVEVNASETQEFSWSQGTLTIKIDSQTYMSQKTFEDFTNSTYQIVYDSTTFVLSVYDIQNVSSQLVQRTGMQTDVNQVVLIKGEGELSLRFKDSVPNEISNSFLLSIRETHQVDVSTLSPLNAYQINGNYPLQGLSHGDLIFVNEDSSGLLSVVGAKGSSVPVEPIPIKAYTFNVSAQNDTFIVPHNGSALVYLNGVLLSPIHYDQSNLSKIVLGDPVENGVVRIITGLIQEIIVP